MEKIIRPLSAHAAFLCIALAVLTQTGCSKSPSANTSAPASATTAQVSSATPDGVLAQKTVSVPALVNRGPRIKGIALGDSPDQVKQALAALVPESCDKCLIQTPEVSTSTGLDPRTRTVIVVNRPMAINPSLNASIASFEFDGEQRLIVLDISGGLAGFDAGWVDQLFNATNMTLQEFAQTFIDTYGIPKLDPTEDGQGLTYRDSEQGWQLMIGKDKTLILKIVETSKQQAKSFN